MNLHMLQLVGILPHLAVFSEVSAQAYISSMHQADGLDELASSTKLTLWMCELSAIDDAVPTATSSRPESSVSQLDGSSWAVVLAPLSSDIYLLNVLRIARKQQKYDEEKPNNTKTRHTQPSERGINIEQLYLMR